MTLAGSGHQTAAQRGGEAKDKDKPLSDMQRDRYISISPACICLPSVCSSLPAFGHFSCCVQVSLCLMIALGMAVDSSMSPVLQIAMQIHIESLKLPVSCTAEAWAADNSGTNDVVST